MQLDEIAGDDLFVAESVGATRVGHHIVDILHKHHGGVYGIEIADKRAMAAWTEHQPAVLAEEGVILIHSHSVGGR